jgi:hypothetical protein
MPLGHLHSLLPYNSSQISNRFLFEMNPHYLFREYQSNNVIDARFIDTWSGFYIDVTGLTFDEPAKPENVNNGTSNTDRDTQADKSKKKSTSSNDKNDTELNDLSKPPSYSCKSPHSYTHMHLFPLHETTIEGVRCFRPNNVYEILKGEYKLRSMVSKTFVVGPPRGVKGAKSRKFRFLKGDGRWVEEK